jgi:hypothetical protein
MTKITKEFLKKVRLLTRGGAKQAEIAGTLCCHRNTIRSAQRRLHLSARKPMTKKQERRILQLLLGGHGCPSVAKILGCTPSRARRVMRTYKICRSRGHLGFRWNPGLSEYPKLLELALDRRHSFRSICRTLKSPYLRTKKVAERIMQAESVLKHTVSPPPQTETTTEEERALRIASKLSQIFASELPQDHYSRAVLFAGLCFRAVDQELLLSLSEPQRAVADRLVASMVCAVATLSSLSSASELVH